MPNKSQTILIEIISSLFILLFVYTGISKLIDLRHFSLTLQNTPLVAKYHAQIALSLPIVELIVALLLFIPLTKRLGLYSSLLLMTVFTIYLGYMIIFTSDRPCNCGGVIQQMTWNQHLAFNIFFLLLSLIGVVLERKRNRQKLEIESSSLIHI